MANLDMLGRLRVPLPFLVGFVQDTTKRLQDVIPRNIEYLAITDDLAIQNVDANDYKAWPIYEWEDSAIVGLFRAWLEDWRACTPHLRGISLQINWGMDYDQWSPRIQHQLRALGAQAGVQLELIDLSDET
ncbi:hypothetical protein BO78DRAFT_428493 [Aspergillus sclerotiicarbonarius CBS 121057]|uniref:Uncharacterized protein n=1 Tax=Aspergillus sclerotiicarbonarius (strain CBS 121057 / IBT 28362) TaxID=1448318 RepID=A0A319EF39_ASPSB|nr:hypothetical protein BO78DRAFT_428493 [Aspergillus sclerotiicarbonarius CBS 121057]